MDFVRACGFSRMHVFPFSVRKGTRAYDMTPKVDKATARRRASELIVLGETLETAYMERMLGREDEVLFEEESAVYVGCLEGYSRRYVRVAAQAAQAAHNEVITVALLRAKDKVIYGEKKED
jgi:threonylcarbamoyladenosine tRNA methylthiotransferase MtaB